MTRIRLGVFALLAALLAVLLGPARVSTQQAALMFLGSGGSAGPTTANAASLAVFPTALTLTARNAGGALMAENTSRWTVVSAPAVSTQASASIAAEAGVRHVADKVCFSAGSTTAPALTNLTVNLRDGATGAGTVIASFDVVITAAAIQNVAPYCTPPLNLPGTTNTAMTLEFSALLTNLFESVTITGFNVT